MTPFKILLIEDDRDDVFLLKRALEGVARRRAVPLAIHYSGNGFEGLSNVGRRDLLDDLPDVVVLDLNMPVMDGMAFLRTLRTEFSLGGIHAVVLTTSGEKAVHDAAFRAGADRVFVKPNTFGELVTIAEKIVTVSARI